MIKDREADICFLVEGSYPYVRGGVSSWVHDLITQHPNYTFSVLAIVPHDDKLEYQYDVPANLINVSVCRLSNMPRGCTHITFRDKKILRKIEQKIISFLTTAEVPDLKNFISLLNSLGNTAGSYTLLNSPGAWQLLVGTYEKLMPQSSFLDYFWSFRALLENFYSILLTDIPPARLYHATCTGYAGLLGARSRLETGHPLFLTEHGIYTNERRVELLTTDWLYHDSSAPSYTVHRNILELRDLWIGTFTNYSKICYEACDKIITLYKENQMLQVADGAQAQKMVIIPNGVDYERFSAIQRDLSQSPYPTIAFIGRIVPIKDLKTFIRTCHVLKGMLPELSVYILGPSEENLGYYDECIEMIEHLGLGEDLILTGSVDIAQYLPKIDVIVLTSISEAQPLVILEAGAAGIPVVATRVGACRELIMGKEDESPQLGAGGAIVPLSNPIETANALYALLTNREYYKQCSHAIQERVRLYYHQSRQQKTYQDLYDSYLRKDVRQ